MSFRFENDNCEVRLAQNKDEILQAQSLRYHVFFELMGAVANQQNEIEKRDFDRFDDICDHLLVIDKTKAADRNVVGNYRLLRSGIDVEPDFFYSHSEYDLSPLMKIAKERKMLSLMELGRSCVHPEYRNNAGVIQLLWRGITVYSLMHHVDLMFGCASFSGIDQDILKSSLSYLYHKRLSPVEWRVKARDHLYAQMDYIDITPENEHQILSSMPPLIKGYLRLGAWIGDGAVIDNQFTTTDVFITLPVSNIPKRYINFFSRGG